MKTINLNEIIEKYRLDIEHYADQDFDESCIVKICLEFGEQLLGLAAENVHIEKTKLLWSMDGTIYPKSVIINTKSIIDTINQIK